ncbi:protein of unknown function [Paenibacillus algorifonticola]|uniref:DUF3885 domain-containing protein n=1 Tax=Paenibacillus algorifonticola TaxID=684063 RepID=A0A1I2HQS1_9BACL|nr:protein of unknown function [Paenibacillus algorifonticola]
MKLQELNASNLLEAIANRSLGLEPIIDGDIYIINDTNKTIFHLYDDRGLDIAAPYCVLEIGQACTKKRPAWKRQSRP